MLVSTPTWFRISLPASMYMVSSKQVSGNKFLMFHLHLWQASSEVAASIVASGVAVTSLLPCHPGNFNKKEEGLKLKKNLLPTLNRKINKGTCNQSGIAKGKTSTNQNPGRTTANETPGQHCSSKYGNNSQPPAVQKQQFKHPPLKMPATDAGETSGICNLRPRHRRHHIHDMSRPSGNEFPFAVRLSFVINMTSLYHVCVCRSTFQEQSSPRHQQ